MARYPFTSEGEQLDAESIGFPTFTRDSLVERVVTADIWAYLDHVTRRNLPETKEEPALAFLEQARDFYEAAANSSLASRPLLYYYAYLNVAKTLILNSGERMNLGVTHGVSDRVNNQQRLHFKTQKVRIGVFDSKKPKDAGRPRHSGLLLPTLMHVLGPSSSRFFGKEVCVLELLGQLPAIHRTYSTVSGLPGRFLAITKFEVRRQSGHMWAVAFVPKRHVTEQQYAMLMASKAFASVFTRVSSRTADQASNGCYLFETAKVAYAPRTYRRAITQLSSAIRSAGVWTVATNRGYRSYFSTIADDKRFPQLAASFAAMYYFGSITRYKPHHFDSLEDKHSWLLSEFLNTDPVQTLYLTASYIGKTEVVAPYALHDHL